MGNELQVQDQDNELGTFEQMEQEVVDGAGPIGGPLPAGVVTTNSGVNAIADAVREERQIRETYGNTVPSDLHGLLTPAHKLDELAPRAGVNASFVGLLQGDDNEYRDEKEVLKVLTAWDAVDILHAGEQVTLAVAEAARASLWLADGYREWAGRFGAEGANMIRQATKSQQRAEEIEDRKERNAAKKAAKKLLKKGKKLAKREEPMLEIASDIHLMHTRMAMWTGQVVHKDPNAEPIDTSDVTEEERAKARELEGNFLVLIGDRRGTEAVDFLFEELDQNRNGFIDAEELVEFMEQMGFSVLAKIPFVGAIALSRISKAIGRDDGKVWPWDLLFLLQKAGLG